MTIFGDLLRKRKPPTGQMLYKPLEEEAMELLTPIMVAQAAGQLFPNNDSFDQWNKELPAAIEASHRLQMKYSYTGSYDIALHEDPRTRDVLYIFDRAKALLRASLRHNHGYEPDKDVLLDTKTRCEKKIQDIFKYSPEVARDKVQRYIKKLEEAHIHGTFEQLYHGKASEWVSEKMQGNFLVGQLTRAIGRNSPLIEKLFETNDGRKFVQLVVAHQLKATSCRDFHFPEPKALSELRTSIGTASLLKQAESALRETVDDYPFSAMSAAQQAGEDYISHTSSGSGHHTGGSGGQGHYR